jgi:YD repeat-containing protein
MKKLISMLLIICMLSVCFVGCDASDPSDTGGDGENSGVTTTEAADNGSGDSSTTPDGEGGNIIFDSAIDEARYMIKNKNYEAAYEKLQSMGENAEAKKLLENFRYLPAKIEFEGSWGKGTAEYTYNELGQLVTIDADMRENSFSSQMPSLGDGLKEFVYDEKGNVTKFTTTYDTYEYTYDANGNMIKSVFKTENIGGGSTEYTYDANGNLIKSVREAYGSYMSGVCEYTYDTNGNLTKETSEFSDGRTEECYEREYVYDAKGNVIEESYNGFVRKYIYDYDANGKIIKKTTVDGGVTEYTYDENGNEIKSVYTTLDYEWLVPKVTVVKEHAYDQNGMLIKATYSSSESAVYAQRSASASLQLVYCEYPLPEMIEQYMDLNLLY